MAMLQPDVCPDCGHHHADSVWAYICIGCPCTTTPIPTPDPDGTVSSTTERQSR